MSDINVSKLQEEIKDKNEEIRRLQRRLDQTNGSCTKCNVQEVTTEPYTVSALQHSESLTNENISRYSRQLILPEIGVKGQVCLGNTSALIVGCGGLGCPAAIYLAAAGIGRLGLVDYDEVELSNLHRQILHTESRVKVHKATSAAAACHGLNSSVECVTYQLSLDSSNALGIIEQYDIVLDATDNVATRYLLNDACVIQGKPLVSGSALRFEGQLTVYNYEGGPCYRCLFPNPPPPATVTNCSDGGVLGVVPGIIGSLQALEAIKIAARIGSVASKTLLLFDALDGRFRHIKLRAKQKTCVVCGETPSVTQLMDYEQFCGAKASDKDGCLSVLSEEDRISVKEYKDLVESHLPHVLLDVRLPVEMDICRLPGSINIPMDELKTEESASHLHDQLYRSNESDEDLEEPLKLFVVCRRGNDSQLAVQTLKDSVLHDSLVQIKDIKGGLTAWAKHIDNNFPTY